MSRMTLERWTEIRSRGKARYVVLSVAITVAIPFIVPMAFCLFQTGRIDLSSIDWAEAVCLACAFGFFRYRDVSEEWRKNEEKLGGAAAAPDVFAPLISAGGSSFEDFYRIYVESIAVPEQKPRDQLAAMVDRPDYRVLLAKRSGRIVGFSVLFLPSREPFALLEYMAVRPEDRSGGVGAELFQHSLPDRPVLVEVDSDLSGDQAINHRRILFYRRVGCRRVEGLSYILPLPGPAPEMELMIHLPSTVDQIPKSTLERWLKVIYRDVYGCSADDPRIDRMMEPVADPARLV